jgi:hypothetical protein
MRSLRNKFPFSARRNLQFASLLLAPVMVFLTGCASARESVQWEFNSEKTQLEPHEQRRADAEYLAKP